MATPMGANDDLICFSHERWNASSSRCPHDQLARAARDRRVFFVEEPVFAGARARLDLEKTDSGVTVVRPVLPPGVDNHLVPRRMRELMHRLLIEQNITRYVLWFCTPMAMSFARDLAPVAVVYDHGSDLPELDESVVGLATYHTQLLATADVFGGVEEALAA
jgi:UDP-galactopyranose mutase